MCVPPGVPPKYYCIGRASPNLRTLQGVRPVLGAAHREGCVLAGRRRCRVLSYIHAPGGVMPGEAGLRQVSLYTTFLSHYIRFSRLPQLRFRQGYVKVVLLSKMTFT